ncbi:Mediator of RNA polymerase II transcription subunit 6 [Gurleya vavrai]
MTDNFENICFRDQNFLNANELDDNNAIDYFSNSQFYDTTCTNEILRMQTKFTNLNELKEDLNKMKGVQYFLNSSNKEKTLFIIYKIQRYNTVDYDLLCVFYILNGTIYQAPTNLSVHNSRLSNFYYCMYECLDNIKKKEFDCFSGFKNEDEENHDPEQIEDVNFLYKILSQFHSQKENN